MTRNLARRIAAPALAVALGTGVVGAGPGTAGTGDALAVRDEGVIEKELRGVEGEVHFLGMGDEG